MSVPARGCQFARSNATRKCNPHLLESESPRLRLKVGDLIIRRYRDVAAVTDEYLVLFDSLLLAGGKIYIVLPATPLRETNLAGDCAGVGRS